MTPSPSNSLSSGDVNSCGSRWPTRREWLWIAVAATATLMVRVATSHLPGFWMDEYQTLWAAQLPLGDLVSNRLAAAHSPLPFLWAKLFLPLGESEIALRTSSAVACAVATVAISLLVIELGARRVLPALLVLVVIHPYWQLIGTLYRYMMPLVAVASLWAWLLARHLRHPSWTGGALVALLGGAALWTAGSAQLIWTALFVFGAGECLAQGVGDRRRRLIALTVPMALAQLAVVPLLALLSGTRHVEEFQRGDFDLGRILKAMLATLFGIDEGPASLLGISDDLIVAVALAIFLASIAFAFLGGRGQGARRLNLFVLCTLVSIFLTAVLVSGLFTHSVRRVRYLAFASVPLTLLVASAWTVCGSSPRLRWLYRVPVAAMIALCFITMLANRSDYHRETVEWIQRERRPEAEPLLLVDPRQISMLAFLGHGRLRGVETISGDLSPADLQGDLRRVFEAADAGFVMIYFSGGREHLEEALPPLLAEGFFLERRRLRAGHMAVYALARTPEGVMRIRGLPPLSQHRVIVPVH